MMKILVIDGPNINLLGVREVEVYGQESYQALLDLLDQVQAELEIDLIHFQSNHEGDLVDFIQANYQEADGIVINPAAYTHTSIALLDALKAVDLPTVEVHLSKVSQREDFRQVNYVRDFAIQSFENLGIAGYRKAINYLRDYLGDKDEVTHYR